jgi:hypothetical protein
LQIPESSDRRPYSRLCPIQTTGSPANSSPPRWHWRGSRTAPTQVETIPDQAELPEKARTIAYGSKIEECSPRMSPSFTVELIEKEGEIRREPAPVSCTACLVAFVRWLDTLTIVACTVPKRGMANSPKVADSAGGVCRDLHKNVSRRLCCAKRGSALQLSQIGTRRNHS